MRASHQGPGWLCIMHRMASPHGHFGSLDLEGQVTHTCTQDLEKHRVLLNLTMWYCDHAKIKSRIPHNHCDCEKEKLTDLKSWRLKKTYSKRRQAESSELHMCFVSIVGWLGLVSPLWTMAHTPLQPILSAPQTLPEICSEQDEMDFLMEALIMRYVWCSTFVHQTHTHTCTKIHKHTERHIIYPVHPSHSTPDMCKAAVGSRRHAAAGFDFWLNIFLWVRANNSWSQMQKLALVTNQRTTNM